MGEKLHRAGILCVDRHNKSAWDRGGLEPGSMDDLRQGKSTPSPTWDKYLKLDVFSAQVLKFTAVTKRLSILCKARLGLDSINFDRSSPRQMLSGRLLILLFQETGSALA